MPLTPFEDQTLAVQQVHGFLLTVLLRDRLAGMTAAEAETSITALLREFATLTLPARTRTDPATLQAISDRHGRAQAILRQMLDLARPHPGAGSSDTGRG